MSTQLENGSHYDGIGDSVLAPSILLLLASNLPEGQVKASQHPFHTFIDSVAGKDFWKIGVKEAEKVALDCADIRFLPEWMTQHILECQKVDVNDYSPRVPNGDDHTSYGLAEFIQTTTALNNTIGIRIGEIGQKPNGSQVFVRIENLDDEELVKNPSGEVVGIKRIKRDDFGKIQDITEIRFNAKTLVQLFIDPISVVIESSNLADIPYSQFKPINQHLNRLVRKFKSIVLSMNSELVNPNKIFKALKIDSEHQRLELGGGLMLTLHDINPTPDKSYDGYVDIEVEGVIDGIDVRKIHDAESSSKYRRQIIRCGINKLTKEFVPLDSVTNQPINDSDATMVMQVGNIIESKEYEHLYQLAASRFLRNNTEAITKLLETGLLLDPTYNNHTIKCHFGIIEGGRLTIQAFDYETSRAAEEMMAQLNTKLETTTDECQIQFPINLVNYYQNLIISKLSKLAKEKIGSKFRKFSFDNQADPISQITDLLHDSKVKIPQEISALIKSKAIITEIYRQKNLGTSILNPKQILNLYKAHRIGILKHQPISNLEMDLFNAQVSQMKSKSDIQKSLKTLETLFPMHAEAIKSLELNPDQTLKTTSSNRRIIGTIVDSLKNPNKNLPDSAVSSYRSQAEQELVFHVLDICNAKILIEDPGILLGENRPKAKTPFEDVRNHRNQLAKHLFGDNHTDLLVTAAIRAALTTSE